MNFSQRYARVLKIFFIFLWILFVIGLSIFCKEANAAIYCCIETRENNETWFVCKDNKRDKKISSIKYGNNNE